MHRLDLFCWVVFFLLVSFKVQIWFFLYGFVDSLSNDNDVPPARCLLRGGLVGDEGDDLPLKLVTQGGLDGEAPNGQLLRIAVIHGHAPFLSPPNWSVLICDTKP